MDKTWSVDAPWDFFAMSNYNTITSLAESPLQEGLIYAGTDDGRIHVTEDGGTTWRRMEVGSLPGVPGTAFVNDIKADLHDANTVYIALDNHKYGDLNPYLVKSTNRGRKWSSIKGNIPERTLVWRLVQDHVRPDLLFAGTEFGIYFTLDGGGRWMKLTGDVPTISFRDLAIQRRENDLVGASFGRGFYVFDDFSVLRHVSEEQLEKEAKLFPTRKAWWYIPRPVMGFSKKASQGAAYFCADNPPFGAVFTYYLPEEIKSRAAVRKENEKKLVEADKDVPFPGWDQLETERREKDPVIWLTVRDSDRNVVRRLNGPAKKGFHRVAWDLRFPSTRAIDIDDGSGGEQQSGVLAAPGDYTVTLSRQVDGTVTDLSAPVPFEVVRMSKGALDGADDQEVAEFWREIARLQRATTAVSMVLDKTLKKVETMHAALSHTPAAPGDLDRKLYELRQNVLELDEQLNGNRARQNVGENTNPTVSQRLWFAMGGTRNSLYGPTPNHRRSLEIATEQFVELKKSLQIILDQKIPDMEKALEEAGAPWLEGQPIPDN
jgi:hypothetical protein